MSAPGQRRTDMPVLVTAVGNGSTGEQIYQALRRGRRSYRLTVTNVGLDRMVVANGARKAVLPSAGQPEYLEALAAAANLAAARFIFPGSDPELHRITAETAALARLTPAVVLANNAQTIRVCADKQATAEAIATAGLRVPVTVDLTGPDDALPAVRSRGLPFPVVIKPRQGTGGSANVHLAQDEEELRFFVRHAEHGGRGLVLQEYVGDAEQEYTVSVLHYPDGALAGSLAIRRHLTSLLSTKVRVLNRTGRADLGATLAISTGFTQGEVNDFPLVCQAAERVARHVGSTGPLNIQGRLVGRDFCVFEINPRFSGTTGIRAAAGHNGPEALIDWHLGTPSSVGGPLRRGSYARGLIDYPAFD